MGLDAQRQQRRRRRTLRSEGGRFKSRHRVSEGTWALCAPGTWLPPASAQLCAPGTGLGREQPPFLISHLQSVEKRDELTQKAGLQDGEKPGDRAVREPGCAGRREEVQGRLRRSCKEQAGEMWNAPQKPRTSSPEARPL